MSLESSQLFISEANWWTSSVTEVDYMYSTPQPFSEAVLSHCPPCSCPVLWQTWKWCLLVLVSIRHLLICTNLPKQVLDSFHAIVGTLEIFGLYPIRQSQHTHTCTCTCMCVQSKLQYMYICAFFVLLDLVQLVVCGIESWVEVWGKYGNYNTLLWLWKALRVGIYPPYIYTCVCEYTHQKVYLNHQLCCTYNVHVLVNGLKGSVLCLKPNITRTTLLTCSQEGTHCKWPLNHS